MGITTLEQFAREHESSFSGNCEDLIGLLSAMQLGGKVVHQEVNKAGLMQHILGAVGSQNVQGEEQQKLDVRANDVFIEVIERQGIICGVGSEELDDHVNLTSCKNGEYVLLMDPLDGSSNIDVNVSIGTIFSVFKRKSPIGTDAVLEDFLQPGTEQVLAGYILYGSSTMLVYTVGNGVHGFTYDPGLGEFCLSHQNMKFPANGGKIYSINEGNIGQCDDSVKRFVQYCQEDNKEDGRPLTARYIGSLVADFHRNLIKGGLYIYPGTKKAPNGKLRLMYECNPLALMAEQAGGKALDGYQRILELEPNDLHQRVPFFVGSNQLTDLATSFLSNEITA